MKHLDALEAIADDNDGTRAPGTAGYEASVAYLVPWLADKGYEVTLQNFEFPFLRSWNRRSSSASRPVRRPSSPKPTSTR